MLVARSVKYVQDVAQSTHVQQQQGIELVDITKSDSKTLFHIVRKDSKEEQVIEIEHAGMMGLTGPQGPQGEPANEADYNYTVQAFGSISQVVDAKVASAKHPFPLPGLTAIPIIPPSMKHVLGDVLHLDIETTGGMRIEKFGSKSGEKGDVQVKIDLMVGNKILSRSSRTYQLNKRNKLAHWHIRALVPMGKTKDWPGVDEQATVTVLVSVSPDHASVILGDTNNQGVLFVNGKRYLAHRV